MFYAKYGLYATDDFDKDEKIVTRMFTDFSFSEAEISGIKANESDMMLFPAPVNVCVAASLIQGRGLFATSDFSKDSFIAPARIGVKRTPAGRYCNHSYCPNA